MLAHISQKNSAREKEILSEARKVFKKTDLAEDLMKVEV
jgi:ribonuclease BN (tRNA processing enzyme)